MYSDGMFESNQLTVLSNHELPSDVMVLYRSDDLDQFLESSKDLAVCRLDFPSVYPHHVRRWLKEADEEYHEACRADEVRDRLSSVAADLFEPFQSLVSALDRRLHGRAFHMTLKVVRDQMCPLFHVDNLRLRVIATLQGPGTQWLTDQDVLRKNLGKAGKKPVARQGAALQEIGCGQVGILKGARFPGSKGLVHRSPPVDPARQEPRVFLRLDYL